MKILVIAGWMYPDEEGGSFRVVYENARGLAARGHQVHVLTQRLDPSHPECQELAGTTVHRYPTTAKSGIRFYASTLRQVRRWAERLHADVGFDALLLHHPVSALAANRARGLAGLPRVMVLHSVYFLEYADRHTYDPHTGAEHTLSLLRRPVAAALRWMDGANLRRSDRVVVLSEFTRLLVERHYPGCAAKVTRLPGGADLDAFRPAGGKAEARARLGLDDMGLPDGPALFFTCRRLEHRMGVVELVEAAHQLQHAGRKVVLLVAGRGALADELKQRIADAELADTVKLLGFVAEDELPLYYRAADCFVLPTRALEGFGLVTAEAFACGTPVLGTPVGATPELIEPFDKRLVTADATTDGLAKGMTRFLDEVAATPNLAARCRTYAEQSFSWDTMTDGLERILGELAQQ